MIHESGGHCGKDLQRQWDGNTFDNYTKAAGDEMWHAYHSVYLILTTASGCMESGWFWEDRMPPIGSDIR